MTFLTLIIDDFFWYDLKRNIRIFYWKIKNTVKQNIYIMYVINDAPLYKSVFKLTYGKHNCVVNKFFKFKIMICSY